MGIEQCAWGESFTIDRQPAISDTSQLPLNQCNVANILLPVLKTAVNTKSLRTAPPLKATDPDYHFAICGAITKNKNKQLKIKKAPQ